MVGRRQSKSAKVRLVTRGINTQLKKKRSVQTVKTEKIPRYAEQCYERLELQ